MRSFATRLMGAQRRRGFEERGSPDSRIAAVNFRRRQL